MLSILQLIHSNVTKLNEICSKVRELFVPTREEFAKLQKLIPTELYYKYHDHWKYAISQFVGMAALVTWLESRRLITLKETEILIGITGKEGVCSSFCLELEDYLLGLCNIPSELSRLSVNSVTVGNYDLPIEISKFIGDLHSGFRLLNLKNDNLRKRYDSMKYDVKKTEEVVYDINIRGLKK